MEIFTIKNVTFFYPEDRYPVLENVNLSIKQGEFSVLFGESGSGKTTLLQLLKKELTPAGQVTGEIYYKNKALNSISNRVSASEIGFVMQDPESQIVTDKVWHELAFGLENIGVESSVIRSKVGEIANYFGIHTWFRKNTSDLSGGQKQLLNLASVMAMQPEVLILDEPTSQLDSIAATNFIHTLKKLNEDLGITIILVEHSLEEVLPIADKVSLIEKGNIIFSEEPRNIGHELLKLSDGHPMLDSLPISMQVVTRLKKKLAHPLTIKEGQAFLRANFHKGIKKIEINQDNNFTTPIIEVKNAYFRYERDGTDVIRNLHITFYKNEIFAIIGGNGSGKSTFLHVLANQLNLYRGKVFIDNKNIKSYKNSELYFNNIAILPQDLQTVFTKDTIREDYKALLESLNFTKEDIEEQIGDIAETLEITNLLDKHPYDISGGERQKAALAKVLLLKPRILLLDEPTKGIDAHAKKKLQEILTTLQKKGMTIIFVTHDIEFTSQIADRVGLYFDSNIISVNSPKYFFTSNNFYTTAAHRMTKNIYENVITIDEIITLCKLNEELLDNDKTMD